MWPPAAVHRPVTGLRRIQYTVNLQGASCLPQAWLEKSLGSEYQSAYLTVIDDDVEEFPVLIIDDAPQKSLIRLVTNVQLTTTFLVDSFSERLCALFVELHKAYLAAWQILGP